MKKKRLSESLGVLSSAGEDMFSNPFDDDGSNYIDSEKLLEESTSSLNEVLETLDSGTGVKKKKKKKYKNDIERLLDVSSTIEMAVDRSSLSFDEYLENVSIGDSIEDNSLKRELTTLGRKFARDNAISADESEIARAFSPQESHLKNQLDDVAEDLEDIKKDISYIRGYRTKNYKSLSELLQVKNQLQATQLNIVKAINDSKKLQFDLKNKEKAKDSNDTTSAITNRALRTLFSFNKKEINDAASNSSTSFYNDDETYGEESYYASQCNQEAEGDGDKFIKYENSGAHYILIINEGSDVRQVITEDKDGNIIPDYPLPTNIDDLDFDINYQAKTAKDHMHRTYQVRIIDENGNDK